MKIEMSRGLGPLSEGPAPLYIQLANLYAPAWGYGGPVRLLFEYAQWLSRDFQVQVFTGDLHHDFTRIPARSESIGGVPIERHTLFFPGLVKKSIYLLSPRMCIRATQRIRAARGPAIVHFSELRGLVPLYALLLKLLFRKRVKLVHSAFGSLHYKSGLRRRVYDALFMKAFVKRVDLRLTLNEHERETYRKICHDCGVRNQSRILLFPIHLSGAPSDGERFTASGKNSAAVREVRNAYGIPQEALVFLFLGRLHPSKGILRMMDAYLEFSRSCSRKTLLLVVGRDDGFQAKVEEHIHRKQAQLKVRIVNNVYDNRFDYYYLADIFLGFPTIFEETMLASIEALGCGTPVIVSREADIPFIEEARAGRVIDFEVSKAAKAMANVHEELGAFQANARRVALRFDRAHLAPKLLELFRAAAWGGLTPLCVPQSDAAQSVLPECRTEVRAG